MIVAVEACADGNLTPSEASALTELLNSYTSVLKASQLAQRLKSYEARLGAK